MVLQSLTKILIDVHLLLRILRAMLLLDFLDNKVEALHFSGKRDS